MPGIAPNEGASCGMQRMRADDPPVGTLAMEPASPSPHISAGRKGALQRLQFPKIPKISCLENALWVWFLTQERTEPGRQQHLVAMSLAPAGAPVPRLCFKPGLFGLMWVNIRL